MYRKDAAKNLGKIMIWAFILGSLFLGKTPTAANLSSNSYLPVVAVQHPLIYASKNLSGHEVFGECNPGGGTNCQCSSSLDANLSSFSEYGQVTSNPRSRNTYVNAIGFKKFTETFPDGTKLHLGKYEYSGSFKLTSIPKPEISQLENAQAVHLMIQLWDGRNALYAANQRTLEGVIYWQLNPWQTSEFGSIKIYTSPADLIDTGYRLEPDLDWHTFTLAVDFDRQEYLYILIGGQNGSTKIDLTGRKLANVFHGSDWGKDVSLSITTESMATWPKRTCEHVFTWTTRFKDLSFYAIR